MNEGKLSVGFLGLGKMGLPMAERLLGTDIELHVFDPVAESVRQMVAAGAVAHPSPLDVANAASIVMACLPNKTVSKRVATGSDGVMHGSAMRVYVEMSTIGRECIESIAKELGERGIRTVDAPVSGGPPVARAGLLSMMVSGAPEDVQRVHPLLARIGKKVHVLGNRPGDAQIMKLVNNLVMATNVIVAAEGLVMAAKAGLDPDVVMDALSSGSGRSFALTEILGTSAFLGKFNFGADLAILQKDVELGVAEATRLDVEVSVIDAARRLWCEAAEEGRAAQDFTAILELIEQRGGAIARSSRSGGSR